MSKSNPTLLDRELLASVRTGIFRSQAEGVQEALGAYFAAKPQYRLEAALEIYRSGEVSLSRAAEIAGMNPVRFRELWIQRSGREEIEVAAADVQTQARRISRRRS
jgi:predicted HTH domain antitoxin